MQSTSSRFAAREKHSAHIKAGSRGPDSTSGVFLIAIGSHLSRKRPQRSQNPFADKRILPRLRLFIRGLFIRLLRCPPYDCIYESKPETDAENRTARGAWGHGRAYATIKINLMPPRSHNNPEVPHGTPGFIQRRFSERRPDARDYKAGIDRADDNPRE